MRKWTMWMLIIACGLCQLSAEDLFISKEDFAKQGIKYEALQPINLSPQGDYLTTLEVVEDVKLKAKGITQLLHVLYFKDKKLAKVDTVQIPVAQRMNAALSDARNEVLIIGNHGNRYVRVDLDQKKAEIVFDYQKGVAGFKAQAMLYAYKGEFFATGWFYDKDQYSQGDALAKLEMPKNGKAKFVKKVDLDKLYKEDPSSRVTNFYYVTGDILYYNMVKPQERTTYLMQYKNKEQIPVAKGFHLAQFLGTESRVFYSVRLEQKSPLQHFMKDLKTQKTWKIGYDNTIYTYPFMSAKGDILVVIVIDLELNAMNVFCGKEKDDFVLKRFLRNEPAGPMKVSDNGKFYMMMRQDGMKYGEIK